MGLCNSCESTSVATAKLILQDGRLQEYSYPVKASFVLQKYPGYFICNSDEMDFGDVVSPVKDEEDLQPGQLYFALPLNWRKHPLQAKEMAALAVKASSALMKSGGNKCGCGRKSVTPLLFSDEKELKSSHEVVAGNRRGGRGRRRNFTAMLGAIPE